jgi:predicted nucleotidyltransferase
MTEASKWRLRLAKQIAPIYAQDPRVDAIAVAGSVGRGCADQWSDVEIGVYWREEPSADDRRELVTQFGILDGDPRPFSLKERDPGAEESDDDVYVGGGVRVGANVELKHKTTRGVETFFDRWEQAGTPPGTRFPEAMQCAIPLSNADLVSTWRKACAEYPDALIASEIQAALAPGLMRKLERAIARDDFVACREQTAQLVVGIVDTLCAINRFYSPSWKWNKWTIDRLKLKPDSLWPRVQTLFSKPVAAVSVSQTMLEDCVRLAGSCRPVVESCIARMTGPETPPGEIEAPTVGQEHRVQTALEGFQWNATNRVSFYCFRGDMFHHELFCRRARQLVSLLCALNDLPEKTCVIDAEFERAPEAFQARFRECFTPDLPVGTDRLDSLIEGSLMLSRDFLPIDEVDRHVARFRGERRPAWPSPPDFLKENLI